MTEGLAGRTAGWRAERISSGIRIDAFGGLAGGSHQFQRPYCCVWQDGWRLASVPAPEPLRLAGRLAGRIGSGLRTAAFGGLLGGAVGYQSKPLRSANASAANHTLLVPCAQPMKSGTSMMMGSASAMTSVASSKLRGFASGRSGR